MSKAKELLAEIDECKFEEEVGDISYLPKPCKPGDKRPWCKYFHGGFYGTGIPSRPATGPKSGTGGMTGAGGTAGVPGSGTGAGVPGSGGGHAGGGGGH